MHGDVQIEGVNAVFVRNELASETSLSGKNLSCNANVVYEEPAAEPDAAAAGSSGSDAGAEPTQVACSRN